MVVCDSYFWNGVMYDSSGVYIDTTISVAGCIHIEILNLIINNNNTSSSINVTACDVYIWAENGIGYTTSGTYIDTSINAGGCVHIDTLILTINNSTNTVSVTACDA